VDASHGPDNRLPPDSAIASPVDRVVDGRVPCRVERSPNLVAAGECYAADALAGESTVTGMTAIVVGARFAVTKRKRDAVAHKLAHVVQSMAASGARTFLCNLSAER